METICKNRKHFCFVCGQFTAKKNQKKKSEKFANLYRLYYDQDWADENYIPQFGCSNCYLSLCEWSDGKKHADGSLVKPKFKEPMLWNRSSVHDENECYFCVNYFTGISTVKKASIRYKDTINTILPVPHGGDSPPVHMPEFQQQQQDFAEDIMGTEFDLESEVGQASTSSEYVPPRSASMHGAPILVNQAYLNHMARKLELSQRKSTTLASLLKNNNLLEPGITMSSHKKRQAEFIPFFQTEKNLTFCSNIRGLMAALNIDYDVEDWRLFIDASKSGLKAILLHNDHAYMPVPVAYSNVLKETYESMQLIFEKIKYNEHKWDVSGDLKVISLIMGLQLGRPRNPCFICTWIQTAKIDHYNATWEHRSSFTIGMMNVKEKTLVPPEKILLPTLHIKLGLIASFMRRLDKNDDAFKYLKVIFKRLSEKKIANGKF